jgi:hypothetical protein
MGYGKLLILIYFFLLSLCLNAQKLDSLIQQLEGYKKEDSRKLDLLNSIAYEYQYINILAGLKTADTAIALAQKLNDKSRLAEAYLMK